MLWCNSKFSMLHQHGKRLSKNFTVFFKNQLNVSYLSSKICHSLETHEKVRIQDMRKSNVKSLVIQVIGSGAHGAPASALLYGDNIRVLINCGEGTQRLIHEHKVRWNINDTHVFITNSSWDNMAGLMGMALSLQSSKKKQMCLHGPELIENVFSATNRFIDIKSLSVKFMNCKNYAKYDANTYEVRYVPLYPSTVKKLKQNISDSNLVTSLATSSHNNDFFSNQREDKNTDSDNVHLSKQNHEKSKKKKRSHSQVCEIKNREPVHYAMAYIFYVDKNYKLLIEKCVDLNVPVGPLLKKLKDGEDVILENGNLVKSSDVLEMTSPSTTVVVVECPSESYLDTLLQEPAFFKHQSGDVADIASAVIHFTKADLIEHSKYKDWINRFPKETKHLFINENNKCLGSVAVHRFQYKLHAIHPEIFPLLPSGGIPLFPRNIEQDLENGHTIVEEDILQKKKIHSIQEVNVKEISRDKICYKCKKNSFINGETLCEVYVRPKQEYDYSRSIILKPHIYISEIEAVEGFLENLKQLKSELDYVKFPSDSNDEKYPKILFLGTGCSQPSIYRNPSGILVFLDDENCMLLDCGEGTYNQLVRFFGKEEARRVLRNLNLIFISHLHSDHHIGLVKLLKQRKAAYDEAMVFCSDHSKEKYQPPYLLAPVQLTKWLSFFSKHFEDISSLYSIVFTNKSNETDSRKDKLSDVLNALNFSEIKTAKMVHCASSYGVAFLHQNNWKLTYSGDTRPSNNLVEIGKDSDILIHEATFDDGLFFMAKSKAHSTTSEAIDIGRRMNAKYILLTHFSQRYSHLPLLDDYNSAGIGLAFDNMMVSYNHLPILPKLLPLMKCLLIKYYDEMVEKRDLLCSKRLLIEEYEEHYKKKAKTTP